MSNWELATAEWRKSSLSSLTNNCVEVAPLSGAIAVRDSKDPEGGALVFDPTEWAAFVGGADRI